MYQKVLCEKKELFFREENDSLSPITYHLLRIQMSMWLRVVMILFVLGCGCLTFTEVPAAEKRASLTKLMTAMVVLDSAPLLETPLTITDDDVDYLRGSRSRLPVGTVISRETALLLALMSSENRAAHALGRNYPGGMPAFLSAMNGKAQQLGMLNSRFEDPTGLTSNNVSTAHDLAKMVGAAHTYQLIRKFTTTAEAKIDVGGHGVTYCNTNPLVKNAAWDVGLSKTGYISEAGKCLVMQARLAEKAVVIVLLDSEGSMTRVGDANRIKQWLESVYTAKKPSIHTVATQKTGRTPS